MDLKQLVALFIKLSGLYLIVWTLVEALASMALLVAAPEDMLYMYAHFGFALTVGVFLWFIPVRITNVIVKEAPIVEDTERFFPRLERLGVLLLGLYLAYRAASDLVYQVSYSQRMEELIGDDYFRDPGRYAGFVQAGAELLIAIFFIFGAAAIVRSVRKAWTFGRNWPDS